MMRVALHTRLKPGAEAAYEAAHREVPAELQARSAPRVRTGGRSGAAASICST